MKGFFNRLGEIWAMAGIALFLLLLVELFFRIYLFFSPLSDPRIQADCYEAGGWVSAYYSEFEECNRTTWEPYTYWQREPFKGEFINIDVDGHRQTVTKSHPQSSKQQGVSIFFFGGSAMWGTGVRDAYTIPSLIGNELIKLGFNPGITNFGESGYVSTQEVIRLASALKQGNIPDIVVFYDGAHEILSVYRSGTAGITLDEKNRIKEFQSLNEKKKALLVFFNSLRTLSTVTFLKHHFGSEATMIREREIPDPGELAMATTHQYNENIRLVNALAKEYGFHALFYWQPTLFDKPYLTDYENREIEKAKSIKLFQGAVNEQLFNDALTYENIRFFNLSGLFVASREPIFIDWSCTGEFGNQAISERMVLDLLPLIDSLKTSRSGYNE